MSLVQRYIESRQWAILQEYLELMSAITLRDDELQGDALQAIERKFGVPVAGTREGRNRNGVAVIPVTGPIFRYANFFTEISGATSFERLATDFSTAMDDEDVSAIVLDINSPGGEVDGTSETAELIRSFRGVKPIISYVSHLGASAALWVASAADRVVVADTAIVGSVGVVATAVNRDKADEKRGIKRMEFVSSQSPQKRVDPFSEDDDEQAQARKAIQARIDTLAGVFIDSVAADRGMTPEAVAATKGAVFVGSDAVDVGFADALGTLEGTIQSLTDAEGSSSGIISLRAAAGGLSQQEDVSMSGEGKEKPAVQAPVINRAYLDANHPELVKQISDEGMEAGIEVGTEQGRKEGADAERERITAIHGIAAPGFDDLKAELMANPEMSQGDAALKILNAKGAQEQHQAEVAKDGLTDDEQQLADVGLVSTSVGTGDDEGTEEDMAVSDVLQHASKWAASGNAE